VAALPPFNVSGKAGKTIIETKKARFADRRDDVT
jgi:hypothetical protein